MTTASLTTGIRQYLTDPEREDPVRSAGQITLTTDQDLLAPVNVFVRLRKEDAALIAEVDAPRSPLPRWYRSVLRKLLSLVILAQGWDSYDGEPIQLTTIRQALETLLAIVAATRGECPEPAIVPTSDGGIQLEWHEGGLDIELSIASSAPVSVFIADDQGERSLKGEGVIEEAARLLGVH